MIKIEYIYRKVLKTTPWHKIQKTFLYHGIKRVYGHFGGGGGIRGILFPA
jgi:hypothetical protein